MNKYAIQSKNFEGSIIVTYFQNKLLEVSFSEAEMTEVQIAAFIKALPIIHESLKMFIQHYGLVCIDTEYVILFADWWELFNMKRNKIEAERAFERLPPHEKVVLWFGTKTYNQYCQRNASWYNKLYPDSFIIKKQYQSEWNKIK